MTFDFNFHVYHHRDETLNAIAELKEILMHTIQEFKAAIAAIATKIDELLARVQQGGLTEAEEHQVFDDLAQLTAKLQQPEPPTP